jgi:hypothetical protein
MKQFGGQIIFYKIQVYIPYGKTAIYLGMSFLVEAE